MRQIEIPRIVVQTSFMILLQNLDASKYNYANETVFVLRILGRKIQKMMSFFYSGIAPVLGIKFKEF